MKMKNPFVQMAIIAAAMQSAFNEDIQRASGNLPTFGYRGARGAPGQRNPVGTKLLRQFYRAKHGTKGSRKEAIEWREQLKGGWL